MKKFVTIIFLLISFLGFGQSVSAPDSKSFLQSTTGQDASGFVLNGFATTDVILASISLVNPPASTTFYLGTTTGLTAASGFTLSGNKTRLVVTGSMANINAALTSLKINTGSVKGNVVLSVAATINPTGYYYNGVNGHFYKPVTATNTYTGARAASLLTTFKGQTGYLVTITSADEDAFIIANVPQSNIWFACTDEVTEGRWIIDAGPEKGTLIKTSNGQLNGNIQGQYNNWAGGEPNNSGNEDYPVTKWGGGTQWNDLPNSFYCAYVIEYGTWTNPDDATFTEFYTNSVTHSNGEVLTARFNFDFGGNVDETKFSAKANTYVNNVWGVTTNTSRALTGLGKADITNDLDTLKVSNGNYKATATAGQWEAAILYEYDATLNGHLFLIDDRMFTGTTIDPNTITNIKVLDIYDSLVDVISTNGWWKTYLLKGNLTSKISASSYSNLLRRQDNWYGTSAAFSFTALTAFKQHGIDLSYIAQTDLNTLYSNIVSVADVYLAFKELSNGGLFGNETGNEFAYGIQYMNADVDGNGVFNEADTYKLLQHLTGVQSINEYSTLTYLMKLYSKSQYDAITKSNWNTQFNYTRSLYPFNLNTGTLNNTYNVSVSWRGDVNLSHSAIPVVNTNTSNSIRTMSVKTMSTPIPNEINASIITEIVGDSVYAYVTIDPIGQELVGTQLQLNYDNTLLKFNNVSYKTKGSPTNYGTDKGTYVNFGSLITDGGILDNTTQYKIVFTTKTKLDNILGLISVLFTDAVNKAGTTLKIRMQ
ncbi:MAG: hypothetical protein RLZZ196_811 [Bacteroidota bacterium]|jgi:hypothetical protein